MGFQQVFEVNSLFSFGCFVSSSLFKLMNVKLLLTLVGLIDFLAFVGLCFWDGQPFTYLIIITVTAGLGFTGGVFESIVPSKSTVYPLSRTSTVKMLSSKNIFRFWNQKRPPFTAFESLSEISRQGTFFGFSAYLLTLFFKF